MKKIKLTRLTADLAGFLASWLSDRASQVLLGGASFAAEVLANTAYQGTVLRPLWNAFFSDSRRALACKGFKETVFADDLNTWRAFLLNKRSGAPHEALLAELSAVQKEVHWGVEGANHVFFDPAKESFNILHRSCQYGNNFKILGCLFDPRWMLQNT